MAAQSLLNFGFSRAFAPFGCANPSCEMWGLGILLNILLMVLGGVTGFMVSRHEFSTALTDFSNSTVSLVDDGMMDEMSR